MCLMPCCRALAEFCKNTVFQALGSSFLPACLSQTKHFSKLPSRNASFIFSNLEERFIIRKNKGSIPFPGHFPWLFPPGSVLALPRGCVCLRRRKVRSVPRAPVAKVQEKRGKRTWISSKESVWRCLSLPWHVPWLEMQHWL